MNIDLNLNKISEQIRYRIVEDIEFETGHQTEDEQEHSEELKKRKKGKDRQSELEQLRAAARAVEAANLSKKLEAEEKEMAELMRKTDVILGYCGGLRGGRGTPHGRGPASPIMMYYPPYGYPPNGVYGGGSREVDDLVAQFQSFSTPLGGSPHGSRSGSPMNYPPYGYHVPLSMAPNGYGGGVPGSSPRGSGLTSPMY